MPTSGKAPAAESALPGFSALRNWVRTVSGPAGSSDAEDVRVAAQALRLRGWALAVLAGTPTDGAAYHASRASGAAWRLFLAVERCAFPLAQRAGAAAVLDSLAPAQRDVFERARMREVQRAMSARMHLATLSRLARRSRTPVVVLKGGVAIAEGETVHVADVDVLVPDGAALAFADALHDEGGFRPGGTDHPDGWGGHHLAPRVLADAVQVEVHFALAGLSAGEVLAQAVPLAGTDGLLRPDAESYLFHTVHHAVVHHPERAGRLRDLLLVARGCTSDATCASVVRRLRSGVAGFRGAALVEFARCLRSGTPTRDPFARLAAANYLIVARLQRTGSDEPRLLLPSACALLNGGGEYRRLWEEQVRTLSAFPPRGVGNTLVRLVPPLFRPLRLLWRTAGIVGAVPRALAVVRQARRLSESDDDLPLPYVGDVLSDPTVRPR